MVQLLYIEEYITRIHSTFKNLEPSSGRDGLQALLYVPMTLPESHANLSTWYLLTRARSDSEACG